MESLTTSVPALKSLQLEYYIGLKGATGLEWCFTFKQSHCNSISGQSVAAEIQSFLQKELNEIKLKG